MKKTQNLDLTLFEDHDAFNTADFLNNFDILNHTACQKSIEFYPSINSSDVKWKYFPDSASPSTEKTTIIRWNGGTFLGNRIVIFGSVTCDRVHLEWLGTSYGPFSTCRPGMEVKIYMPSDSNSNPIFSSIDQIDNVYVVPMCEDVPVWTETIGKVESSSGIYIMPNLMGTKYSVNDIRNPLGAVFTTTITFNVCVEGHLSSDYDKTLGLTIPSGNNSIFFSDINQMFNTLDDDKRTSNINGGYARIDTGYLKYMAGHIYTRQYDFTTDIIMDGFHIHGLTGTITNSSSMTLYNIESAEPAGSSWSYGFHRFAIQKIINDVIYVYIVHIPKTSSVPQEIYFNYISHV